VARRTWCPGGSSALHIPHHSEGRARTRVNCIQKCNRRDIEGIMMNTRLSSWYCVDFTGVCFWYGALLGGIYQQGDCCHEQGDPWPRRRASSPTLHHRALTPSPQPPALHQLREAQRVASSLSRKEGRTQRDARLAVNRSRAALSQASAVQRGIQRDWPRSGLAPSARRAVNTSRAALSQASAVQRDIQRSPSASRGSRTTR
jgi:hypothetical protein